MKKTLLATLLLISFSANADCYFGSDDDKCPNNEKVLDFYTKLSSMQENESMVLDGLCTMGEDKKMLCRVHYAGYLSFGSGGSCTLFSRNPISFKYVHHAGRAFIRYNMSAGWGFVANADMCKKVIYEESWDYIESEEEKKYNAEVEQRKKEYLKELKAKKDAESNVKSDEEYRKEFEEYRRKKRQRGY